MAGTTVGTEESRRFYAREENGGRMTVRELIKSLAEVPQDAAVFFCYEHEIADEPICGLTAEREPVETVQVIYWREQDGSDAIGYVRLVGQKRGDTWAGRFPCGRTIFYAGDNAEGFRAQINEEFGFDPGADADWGRTIDEYEGEILVSYNFHCPAEHLDAIYGSGRFPMGS